MTKNENMIVGEATADDWQVEIEMMAETLFICARCGALAQHLDEAEHDTRDELCEACAKV